MSNVCFHAVGRRKKAIARVRLIPGEGNITVNKRNLEEYFGYELPPALRYSQSSSLLSDADCCGQRLSRPCPSLQLSWRIRDSSK